MFFPLSCLQDEGRGLGVPRCTQVRLALPVTSLRAGRLLLSILQTHVTAVAADTNATSAQRWIRDEIAVVDRRLFILDHDDGVQLHGPVPSRLHLKLLLIGIDF